MTNNSRYAIKPNQIYIISITSNFLKLFSEHHKFTSDRIIFKYKRVVVSSISI